MEKQRCVKFGEDCLMVQMDSNKNESVEDSTAIFSPDELPIDEENNVDAQRYLKELLPEKAKMYMDPAGRIVIVIEQGGFAHFKV